MDIATRTRILEAHRQKQAGIEPPASEAQLQAFEKLFGAIPADVRWYLSACGGGRVGDERVEGVRALAFANRRLAAGEWEIKSRDAFMLGWDATGGPIALDRRTGEVLVEDGFFGGVRVLSRSFEQFLVDGIVHGRRRWTGSAPAHHHAAGA